MKKQDKIYIAGHNGMVGSAILENLSNKGFTNVIGKSFDELDLCNQADVKIFFETENPDYVIVAAAKVGGIIANNTYRAQFIYENLQIQNNIIHQSYINGVKKLLFLGSSCIYPKNAPQPLKEEFLLTGPLEYTNEPYAIAKIAGIKMCENYFRQYGCNFISVMPTNLYGPNDNYDLEKSHVLPALIRKFHLGKCLENNDWIGIKEDLNKRPINNINGNNDKEDILDILMKYGIKIRNSKSLSNGSNDIIFQPVEIELWGNGQVYREFMHVNDMAKQCISVMQKIEATKLYNDFNRSHINIGTGKDLTISELAEIVKKTIGFLGIIKWDCKKPDGTLKKQLDISLLAQLDFINNIPLKKGITEVYNNHYK